MPSIPSSVAWTLGALCWLACSSEVPPPGGSAGAGGANAVAAGSTNGASGGAGAASGGTASGGDGGAMAASGAGGLPLGGSAGAAGGGAGSGAGGGGGAAGAAGAGSSFSGTAQVMVLGSSNELQTCWRALLWQKLRAAGIEDFDFVGGVSDGPDCGVPGYDKDLQAQSGIIISNLTEQQMAGWFGAHPPEALLVHYGGADLLQNMPIPGIMAAYTRTLEQARLVEPGVRFLIGQHTPMTSGGCNDCENTVPELNDQIASWALEKSTALSPVIVVDLETGVDPATDTSDGIHLNTSGSTKVAERFFAALSPFFAK